jgi:hypothetical protein
MKIAYLHGLESTIDKNDPKIIFMNNTFDEVYAPSINYKDPSTFNKLFSEIKRLKPDLIVGSSMGGYVSYLIGSKLSIETILFNPAMVGRSFDPVVDNSSLKVTTHNVYSGKNDRVIDGNAVKKYFNEEGVGNFKYNLYDGEHRVPTDVFINAIKNILKIIEINNITKIDKNNMKHIKLFEQHVLEGEKQDVIQKINDVGGSIRDLQSSIKDMGQQDEPDQTKIAIAQLKIQKQNLKNQMLQLDLRIIALKDTL